MLRPFLTRCALLAGFLLLTGTFSNASAAAPGTTADGQSSYDEASDPPSRVARLKYISGQVSFRPASLDDWGVATANYPLTTGDHLWTERGARAELHLGVSVIRLAQETAFAFLNLDADIVQARVAEGSIDIRVRELLPRETYEINTPNAAIVLVRPGIYRIHVEPDGRLTRLTVRQGLAEVSGNNGSFSVYAGDAADISGLDEMAFDIGRAWAPDGFEQWCRSRDEREDRRPALRYVSREMIGYEDLDDHGTWDYVPEYGWAWQPTVVAVDWAPYRYGRWTWVRPWGWTWVDNARWGFAPFHYGRWTHHRNRWLWVPGRMVGRPVWAPALVAFVGGHNWNFSFGFGARPAVGWFPLGPGELYYPSYRFSHGYLRNLNVTHVHVTNINVTNINVTQMRYANRHVNGAMTAVPRDVFVGSQAIQRGGYAVPRGSVDQVPVMGHAVAVAPGSRSVLGHVGTAVPRPSAAASRRAVVARSAPPSDVVRNSPVVPIGAARARGGTRGLPAQPGANPGLAAPDRSQPAGDRARARAEAPETGDNTRPARGREAIGANVPDAATSRGREQWSTPSSQQAQPERGDRAVPRGMPGGSDDWRPPQSRGVEPSRRSENERPSPRAEQPAQTGDRPVRGWERTTPNEERPARIPERVSPSEDRPSRGERAEPRNERPSGRDTSEPPARSAAPERSRGDDRANDRSAPARAERPSPQPTPAAPAAKPPERGGERKPPASGGRGGNGQSQGNARPRRGGQ